MKRRHRAVYNRDTKVQMALVNINNTEKKAIVIDHLRNFGFIEDSCGDMRLSVGIFNSAPKKYTSIKRLIAGNFSSNDSEIINKAIIGASMKSSPKTENTEPPQSDVENVENPIITAVDDLEREISMYNNAFQAAQQLAAKIDSLIDSGISKEYVLSRYPNIIKKIWELDSVLCEKKINLNHALEKKSAIKSRIEKLEEQLQAAEYDEYLAREEYIIELQSCTKALDFDDSIKPMIEEDLAELDRLRKIKDLEEKLAALKSESKLFLPVTAAPSTPAPTPVAEKPAEKPVAKLEVELPTEQQDKEIRFLANHLYQVRRGNEEHNPMICRRIADLSAKLKMTKAEFCKKILSISVQCWDDRHKKAFTALGLHLHGERRPTDSKKKKDSDYKDTIKRWASTHIIAADGNDVLNSDVYDKFVRDTGFSDIAKISFYNILARSLGYTHKCKYRRDVHGKTICDTYYAGYRLV